MGLPRLLEHSPTHHDDHYLFEDLLVDFCRRLDRFGLFSQGGQGATKPEQQALHSRFPGPGNLFSQHMAKAAAGGGPAHKAFPSNVSRLHEPHQGPHSFRPLEFELGCLASMDLSNCDGDCVENMRSLSMPSRTEK